MKKEDKQAQLELAKAMDTLASAINRITDPVWMQKIVNDAVRGMTSIANTGSTSVLARALPGINLDAVTVSLSEEERTKLVDSIYSKLEPQLSDFATFTKESLKNMPAHRLKELGEKVAEGKEPKLRQKPGCIFIETESDDPGGPPSGFYLGL